MMGHDVVPHDTTATDVTDLPLQMYYFSGEENTRPILPIFLPCRYYPNLMLFYFER